MQKCLEKRQLLFDLQRKMCPPLLRLRQLMIGRTLSLEQKPVPGSRSVRTIEKASGRPLFLYQTLLVGRPLFQSSTLTESLEQATWTVFFTALAKWSYFVLISLRLKILWLIFLDYSVWHFLFHLSYHDNPDMTYSDISIEHTASAVLVGFWLVLPFREGRFLHG